MTAVLVYAHPYPNRSRANRVLLAAVESLAGLRVRSLYDLYPDFGIDVRAEQAELTHADLVIWQHPMYWYSVPGLLKHWFDKVLARGWAYGEGGTALAGKRCLWVTTTGGDTRAFSPPGIHAYPFSAFVPHVEQTARFCGMRWLEPLVVHGAHRVDDSVLADMAERYKQRVEGLMLEAGIIG
ncbi:MAG TPA: glutathione-regulated potassium-efflux system oxidoreductase KefF [Polyangiaceae bacterium]|nr:glutathione-regulated potassium-efflux system oxidoreductase KefF [Polyangiaceae bacterium]